MGTRRQYQRPGRGALESAEPRAEHAQTCLYYLQLAQKHARWAGLGFTLPRINKAIDSARGAVRNAGYRITREERRTHG